MTFNKKLLAGTIAGLLVSANAGAVVLGTDPARRYAVELEKPVLLTDAADNVEFALGYNFSPSEVRYGRFECTANIEIDAPVVVSGGADIAVGAVNGAGTPAIFFSLTAADPLGGPTAPIVMSVTADNTLLDNSSVNCAFSIYDQPSQAQAGGAAGRIYTTGYQPFITSVPSFEFIGTPGQAIADVEAPTGAYTQFLGGAVPGWFGNLDFSLVAAPPYNADGSVITFAALFDPTTYIEVEGDFSAAAPPGWNFYGPADSFTDTEMVLEIGANENIGDLGIVPNTVDQLQESEYYATLFAVANPGFEIDNVGPEYVGEVVRNGTQLQAPLAQVPGGWISRVVLTNTGDLARDYEISVFGETGTTISTDAAEMVGQVPANGTKVIEVPDFLTGFTGGLPRATVNVTVAGPNNQIQGLYQIVNPASGSISNHVMVRPGTN
ncbi:MAG: hypothetical protein ABIH12_03785 [Pseudomonadota bacterium]